jgi:predicted MFS family arabinose efflux permease
MTMTTTPPPPPPATSLPPSPAHRPAPAAPAHPIVAVVVVTAVALAFADASIVALALPDLYIEFSATIPDVSWVLTAYALAVAVAGAAGLLFIKKVRSATLAAVGSLLFALSSVAAGLAPTLSWLIAARVVQGVGGAALVAGALGVLATLLGESRRAGAWWAAAGVAGAALGPALGGALTQLFDWRAVFLVQAPIAAIAVIAAWATRGRTESLAVDHARRARGALVADIALALTFAALVGVLFLGVLLLVVVWGFSPIVSALVVSALPVGTILSSRVSDLLTERVLVVAGAASLAGGLVTMAFLPAISAGWVAAALALCGVGFGALVTGLGRLTVPDGSGVRAATLTSTARHLGLVLGLAIIAPVLSTQVLGAAEVAPLPATQVMLDAPIGGLDKIRIALDIRDLLDEASSGEVPDLDAVFVENGAADDPDVARLQTDIEYAIESVMTRSFRDSFLVAAVFAALAGLVAVGALARGGVHPDTRRRPAGVVVLPVVIAASVLVPAAAVAAVPDDFGQPVMADPCAAPPDPFPGDGFDAAAQRLVLTGLNGAACDLGVSREELVLSFEPRSGVDVRWDSDTIETALRAGVDRAITDAEHRGTLPGWLAGALRWTAERAPVSWFLDRLGVE